MVFVGMVEEAGAHMHDHFNGSPNEVFTQHVREFRAMHIPRITSFDQVFPFSVVLRLSTIPIPVIPV